MLGQYRTLYQSGRRFTTLLLVHFPGDDFTAEDIHDQVQIKEPAAHAARQIANVPGPDFIGRFGLMRGRRPAFLWCFRAAPMMQLIRRLQDTIKAGFRSQIHALVRQSRHDPTGCRPPAPVPAPVPTACSQAPGVALARAGPD